ncbi:hypothetical protein WR25_18676 [Diploscapter pachys]|uniref:Aldose 1-epimerase n=1 Tax=Diploscapter pachys TaxID=2018661 RepID=A0A2A2JA81_9BILA|nr:hypothetical protein WR25_18676 [Diploscapter pachys]
MTSFDFIEITNEEHTVTAYLLPYAATLASVIFQDKNKKPQDLVLGFSNKKGYLEDTAYLGRTIGRIANRIKNGEFEFRGKTVNLHTNLPPHHLHGGPNGIAKRDWEVRSHSKGSVTFGIKTDTSIDSYPGDAIIEVTYTINDKNQLVVEHSARCTEPGVLALTNHAYWNLDGSDSIHAHRLHIAASTYLPVDETNLATGEIASVENTKFDFREPKELGAVKDDDGMIDLDNDWILDKEGPEQLHQLSFWSNQSGIRMDIQTSYPAIHLYAAKRLNTKGKEDAVYGANKALAIEPQLYSSAVNYPGKFPSVEITPEKPYSYEIIYSFSHI